MFQAMTWVCDNWTSSLFYFTQSYTIAAEASILKAFMSDMKHGPFEIEFTNKQLEDYMRAEMELGNFACDQLENTLHLAASLMEVLTAAPVSGLC